MTLARAHQLTLSHCPANTHWDIARTATSYVTLTTLIAAITVTALVVIMPTNRRTAKEALILLPAVLVASLFSSHMFAVLSAEANCRRAYSEGLYASVPLALGLFALFTAIAWLLTMYNDDAETEDVRKDRKEVMFGIYLAFLALVLAVAVFFATLLNQVAVIVGGGKSQTFFSDAPLYVMAVPAVGVWVARLLRNLHTNLRAKSIYVGIVTLVISLLCTLKFSLIAYTDTMKKSELLPAWVRWTITVTVSIAMVLSVCALPQTHNATGHESESDNPAV
jgi:hypothetical protein